jgi:hypothetical protein
MNRFHVGERIRRGGLLGLVSSIALVAPAWANCIAHQPPNAIFPAPRGPELQWTCVTGGPLFGHERNWYLVTFKVTNAGERRTAALKLQANLVDAFGDVLLAIPIVENAKLGTGDSDAAVWAFHPRIDPNSIDHVAFGVLAVKYVDGDVWTNPASPLKAGPTPAPEAALRRFSIAWDTYDMSDVIAPKPSPSPSPSPSS